MTFDGGALTRDPPIRPVHGELLHESERTRVTRLTLPADGGGNPTRVVRKVPLGPHSEQRLRHETAALERLTGVPGVVQLAPSQPYPDSLLLTDGAGGSLAEVTTPLAPTALVKLGLALARAVDALHRAGMVHRDINPANIVLAGAPQSTDPRPRLIDFALATTATEIHPEFTHLSEIVGTLPYLAPEQTGRAGRPVDQRADLYALGATFYELATGAPPFGTGDPLRLSHDHLARVPVPPDQVNPAVPPVLSRIIMHLLEKEPDNRYQTADGLVQDLARVAGSQPDELAGWRVGEHDYPLRLRPPSRLAGRDAQLSALANAFAAAMSGRSRGVMVSGAPGVGKTSLIDELRPIVTASNGWFVAGKSDQYRRDQEFEAGWQAFRQLGRLLLAEPEEELAELRPRLLGALGRNAGLLAALHPEFGTLLHVDPDPELADPLTTQARLQRIGLSVLREVASPKRPVVLVLDDLQWAGRTPLSFVDAVMSEGGLEGLLVVGAYREEEVDANHPLTAMLARWRRQKQGPEQLRLENLSATDVADLLVDVLRVEHDRADALAALLTPHTGGNPYDTVELLNSLRRDGLLVPGEHGWHWDPAAVRHRLDRTVVADLVADRADTMPPATRSLLQTMACLGGRVDLGVLRVAAGLSVGEVERQLEPALDEGLLQMDPARPDSVQFRHDRVRADILRRLRPRRLRARRLRLARRLAARPGLYAVAAEQYLPVIDAVHGADERRQVVGLLRRAAEQAQLLSNYAVVERCLTAAGPLIDMTDTRALIEVHTGRHTALYNLGRLEEADDAYQTVVRLCTHPLERADATLVQVSSLTNRNRPQQALRLGLELLRQLGRAVPSPQQLDAEVERGLADLYEWLAHSDETEDLRRPEITDPALLTIGALLNRIMPAAYFCDHSVLAWLTLQAWQIWTQHGPGRTLVGPVSHALYVIIGRREDFRTSYQASRRVLAVSEARGYEPDTSQSRFLYALGAWSQEPLEECLRQAERAREGLSRGGDLQNACFTYHVTVYDLLECAPSLPSYLGEVESALGRARRTGNEQSVDSYLHYQRLVRTLRGEGTELADASPEAYANNRTALIHLHLTRAIAAALFGDSAELARHTAAMMPLVPAVAGTYPTALGRVLRALALAEAARTTPGAERGELLAELDELIGWVAARAADAPGNFLHLLRLIEAERAWALGEFRTAAGGFDAATREAADRQRPWHRALILERAARFHLAHGMEHAGHGLLAQARRGYGEWGATAKVNQLDWAYPTLQQTLPALRAEPSAGVVPGGGTQPEPAAHRSSITPGTIDLLGILTASQALSSETSIDGLRTRVADVLSAMTGATGVRLLLWSDEEQGWLLIAPAEGGTVPLEEAGTQRLVPVSAVRYAERTGEPLVVGDATRDDRFARDPYFTGLACCSLLVVPIRSQGELRALVLLENRLIRSAFAADRLDGVMLIAGQLAVSLHNAMIYASLERKVAERTEELALANTRLERLSVTDALTGLANRRRLEEVLGGEWERARRAKTPVALAMVDIDHFKLYNDRYGHAGGDRCLQRVAALLRRHLRGADLVARYGGEEFAVVMPGANLDAALRAAERLRAAVVALAEQHPLVSDRIVTVSIGVASMIPPRGSRVEQLSELADTELYRAKRSGRNRVRPAPNAAPGG